VQDELLKLKGLICSTVEESAPQEIRKINRRGRVADSMLEYRRFRVHLIAFVRCGGVWRKEGREKKGRSLGLACVCSSSSGIVIW